MKTEFKKLIMTVELTEQDKTHFIHICSNWERYCTALTASNKYEVIKLLKYLITERVNSRSMLERCIGRFNRLNALRKEVLK